MIRVTSLLIAAALYAAFAAPWLIHAAKIVA